MPRALAKSTLPQLTLTTPLDVDLMGAKRISGSVNIATSICANGMAARVAQAQLSLQVTRPWSTLTCRIRTPLICGASPMQCGGVSVRLSKALDNHLRILSGGSILHHFDVFS